MRTTTTAVKKPTKESANRYESLDAALKAKQNAARERTKGVKLPDDWLHKTQ